MSRVKYKDQAPPKSLPAKRPRVPKDKASDFFEMVKLKHEGAPGGLLMRKRGMRKFRLLKTQSKRAKSGTAYAVIFFPKINNMTKASVFFYELERTLARSPEAAIVKFCDGIGNSKGEDTVEEKWKTYHHAGHRVRKVKIMDLGDA